MIDNYVFWFVPMSASMVFFAFIRQLRPYYFFFSCFVFFCACMLLFLRDVSAPKDYLNYYYMYEGLDGLSGVFEVYHKNYSFSILQWVGKIIGLSADQFYLIFSILCYALSFWAIKLLSSDNRQFLISISLFGVTSTFVLLFTNVVRQGLALSFLLMVLGLYIKKRYLGALIFMFLAVTAHSTSFVFLIAFGAALVFPHKQRSGWLMLLVIPVLPLIGQTVLLPFSSFLGGVFLKVESYSDYEYQNAIYFFKMIVVYFYSLLFFFFMQAHFSGDALLKLLFWLYAFLIAIAFISYPVPIVSSRFMYYASALMPLLVSRLVSDGRFLHVVLKSFLLLLLCAFYGFFVYFYPSTAAQLGIGNGSYGS